MIDELRGLLIILVVVYHLVYNLIGIGPAFLTAWLYSPLVNALRDVCISALIGISGTSCRLSHSNLRRGLRLCFFALLLTLFTAFFVPEQIILFGILHCLGVCILLFAALRRWLDPIPPLPGFSVCALLTASTWRLRDGRLFFFYIARLIPAAQTPFANWLRFFLGLPSTGIFSADYFSLLPWLFVFLAGCCLGRPIQSGAAPAFVYRSHSRLLAFAGRNAFFIYLLHQPIAYGVIWLISLLN